MVYRQHRHPLLSADEREAFHRICQAVRIWIEHATPGQSLAERVFYIMYEELWDPRADAEKACEQARIVVLGRAEHDAGRKQLVELVEAIAALVGFVYSDDMGMFGTVVATLEGDEAVNALGREVFLKHEALMGLLGSAPVAEATREALAEQALGLRQLGEREPFFAWITLGSALRKWQLVDELHKGDGDGNDVANAAKPETAQRSTAEPETAKTPAPPAAPKRDPELQGTPVELPTGCTSCLRNRDVEAGMHYQTYSGKTDLFDESHVGVALKRCSRCGQAVVTVFEEEIDWSDGDDAQSFFLLGITPSDEEELRSAKPDDALSVAKSLRWSRPRLYWDHPTGRSKTVGRRWPLDCPRCEQRMPCVAVAPAQTAVLKHLGVKLVARLAGQLPPQAPGFRWRCPRCKGAVPGPEIG